jgi:hypothetical protein
LVVDQAVERAPALRWVAEALDPLAFWALETAERLTPRSERAAVERFVVAALADVGSRNP